MQATVRSLALAMNQALEEGLSLELIVVMDRPDQLTKKYVEQGLPLLINSEMPVTIKEVDFGDLSKSRNYGIELAQGKYVGAVDADDLFSENLITASIATIKSRDKPVAVHPEYILSFDNHNEIFHAPSSTDTDFDKASLVEYNYWTSMSFTVKKIRKEYPYKTTNAGEGFGPEDWQWNIDTLGAGIDHIIAPRTALFYRRKPVGSLAKAHESFRSLLYKTDLLRDMTLTPIKPLQPTEVKIQEFVTADSKPKIPRTAAQRVSLAPRFVLARTGKAIGPAFRRHRRTQAFEHYMRIALRELFATSTADEELPRPIVEPAKRPAWLIEEWRKQHEFDHRLFPDPELLLQLPEHLPRPSAYTTIYWTLLKKMQLDADYVFLVPWLKTGGADLVVLNYVDGILGSKPDAKITVLATELTASPWKDRLSKSVRFVTLDEAFYLLNQDQQTRLLGTLLVQISPKYIHVINSAIGHKLFAGYAKPLSRVAHLYVSLFSVDHLATGRRVHELLNYLNDSIDYIQKVLTDNQCIIDKFVLWLALPKGKFALNYQPFSGEIVERHNVPTFSASNPLNVLWAGRLDREKHPEILMKIAKEARHQNLPVTFHVYGSQVLHKDDTVEKLQACPNVTYHGPFSKGVGGLPLKNYQLFLMTSEYEGMPNALFEATGGGLPVMAPAVGGIPEFIQPGKTGYLVSVYDNIPEYIRLLKNIIDQPDEAYVYLANAQKLLRTRHSWETFMHILQKQGYL